jgi:MFS family permease
MFRKCVPKAVYEAGAFGGAVLAFFIGDRLGRLKMMWIGAIWMIVGTVIACASYGDHWGFGQFIIARVVSGVGTGMLTATIPSWVAECSKAHNRGFLICSEASTVAVGTVIAYWINYGCVSLERFGATCLETRCSLLYFFTLEPSQQLVLVAIPHRSASLVLVLCHLGIPRHASIASMVVVSRTHGRRSQGHCCFGRHFDGPPPCFAAEGIHHGVD